MAKIHNTYFIQWAFLAALVLGIAVTSSQFYDFVRHLQPYKIGMSWFFFIKLPILLGIAGFGFLILSLVLLFVKEPVNLDTKLMISCTLAVPFLFGTSISDRDTVIYLDNGGSEEVKIEIRELGYYTIPPHEYKEITIPLAPLTIIAGVNDTITFTPTEGRYMYNYRQYNVYEIEELTYAAQERKTLSSFLRSGSYSGRSIKFTYSEKLFSFNADFLFTAPERISVSQNTSESTRTVMLRVPTNYSE